MTAATSEYAGYFYYCILPHVQFKQIRFWICCIKLQRYFWCVVSEDLQCHIKRPFFIRNSKTKINTKHWRNASYYTHTHIVVDFLLHIDKWYKNIHIYSYLFMNINS